MAEQLWGEVLGPERLGVGASYNTSAALTDVSYGAATNPLLCPGGKLNIGTYLEIDAFGTYATSGTTPTLILGFYYGAVAGIALAASAAVTVSNTVTVNWPWRLHYEGTVYATGTSGSIEGAGWLDIGTSLTALTHAPIAVVAQAPVTIDTTVQKAITCGATWGTSAAANILFCRYIRAVVFG